MFQVNLEELRSLNAAVAEIEIVMESVGAARLDGNFRKRIEHATRVASSVLNAIYERPVTPAPIAAIETSLD